MKIEYRFELDGELLKVYTSGIAEKLEDTFEYAQAVIDMVIKHGSKNLFCDEQNLKHGLDSFDTVRLARQIKEATPWVGHVAILVDKHELEEANFYETVTNNRGLFFMITSDYDKAMEWLK